MVGKPINTERGTDTLKSCPPLLTNSSDAWTSRARWKFSHAAYCTRCSQLAALNLLSQSCSTLKGWGEPMMRWMTSFPYTWTNLVFFSRRENKLWKIICAEICLWKLVNENAFCYFSFEDSSSPLSEVICPFNLVNRCFYEVTHVHSSPLMRKPEPLPLSAAAVLHKLHCWNTVHDLAPAPYLHVSVSCHYANSGLEVAQTQRWWMSQQVSEREDRPAKCINTVPQPLLPLPCLAEGHPSDQVVYLKPGQSK